MQSTEIESVGNEIELGACYRFFAFELGLSVKLDAAYKLISETREFTTFQHGQKGTKYFDYDPRPLRVTKKITPIAIPGSPLGCSFVTSNSVELTIYDFGAVSVGYNIPLTGPFVGLVELSSQLYDHQELLEDARRQVTQLMAEIATAVVRPELSDLYEEYLVFDIDKLSTVVTTEKLLSDHPYTLAKVLRCEREYLSDDQVKEALWCKISYNPDDLTIIDWNGAFIFGGDSADVRAVLEFANVQLLETRFLDEELDDALEESYHALTSGKLSKTDLVRIGELQVDAAVMYEESKNALKLLGDQFLARVYSLTAERFHLADWDSSIRRKLETLNSIYTKMSDRADQRRTELLEWAIILLFIFEIAITFLGKKG